MIIISFLGQLAEVLLKFPRSMFLARRSFVIVLVLEKSEPYETFERERGPDNVTGDTILQQTDSALAEFEGFFEHEHDYD